VSDSIVHPLMHPLSMLRSTSFRGKCLVTMKLLCAWAGPFHLIVHPLIQPLSMLRCTLFRGKCLVTMKVLCTWTGLFHLIVHPLSMLRSTSLRGEHLVAMKVLCTWTGLFHLIVRPLSMLRSTSLRGERLVTMKLLCAWAGPFDFDWVVYRLSMPICTLFRGKRLICASQDPTDHVRYRSSPAGPVSGHLAGRFHNGGEYISCLGVFDFPA
jgi:hypothetical protein